MKFEYDNNKSDSNKKKHGLDFEQAKRLWLEENIILPVKNVAEERLAIIAPLNQKLHTCIFTVRGKNVRIISCRRSRKKEEKIYYENIV